MSLVFLREPLAIFWEQIRMVFKRNLTGTFGAIHTGSSKCHASRLDEQFAAGRSEKVTDLSARTEIQANRQAVGQVSTVFFFFVINDPKVIGTVAERSVARIRDQPRSGSLRALERTVWHIE